MRQCSTAHNLSSVFVSVFSFAFSLRTVLLSIPHFSRKVYVDTPLFFMVSQSLSNLIKDLTPLTFALDFYKYGDYNPYY